jgi:carotenoid 1,2-hydratase
MTERGRAGLTRSEDVLSIGPSAMRFDGDGLTIEIDEVAVPRPARIRGRVRVVPEAITGRVFDLDGHGRHRWSPIAPSARVEVALERPALRWHGTAYLDSNDGDEPLEDSFVRWDWSRASADGISTILYEPTLRAGERAPLALRIDRAGAVTEVGPPPAAPLPPTRWRMERATRAEEPGAASVIETLEDAPFYARSLLRTRLFGEDLTAVHESLSLDRFRHPVVQLMLPFRMPRRARWTAR